MRHLLQINMHKHFIIVLLQIFIKTSAYAYHNLHCCVSYVSGNIIIQRILHTISTKNEMVMAIENVEHSD